MYPLRPQFVSRRRNRYIFLTSFVIEMETGYEFFQKYDFAIHYCDEKVTSVARVKY